MHDLPHRFAIALLLICGFLSAVALSWDAGLAALWNSLADPWGLLQTQHRHFMLGLLGASLVLSAFVPALRFPTIAASALSKAGYLALLWGKGTGLAGVPAAAWLEGAMLVALLAAGGLLLREAWQDARWHGVLPLRAET